MGGGGSFFIEEVQRPNLPTCNLTYDCDFGLGYLFVEDALVAFFVSLRESAESDSLLAGADLHPKISFL